MAGTYRTFSFRLDVNTVEPSFGEGLQTPPFGRPKVSRWRADGRGLGDLRGRPGDYCPSQLVQRTHFSPVLDGRAV